MGLDIQRNEVRGRRLELHVKDWGEFNKEGAVGCSQHGSLEVFAEKQFGMSLPSGGGGL